MKSSVLDFRNIVIIYTLTRLTLEIDRCRPAALDAASTARTIVAVSYKLEL